MAACEEKKNPNTMSLKRHVLVSTSLEKRGLEGRQDKVGEISKVGREKMWRRRQRKF